jgi:drug/metabolite transporter (DMT)-like permease
MPDLIAVVAIAMPFFLVCGILWIRHLARSRELTHIERMRAIERGLPSVPSRSRGGVVGATWIAAGVPIAALLFAWATDMRTHAGEKVWLPAMMIGVTAIITGSILISKVLIPDQIRNEREDDTWRQSHNKPPRFDPDAYDVVGRRG